MAGVEQKEQKEVKYIVPFLFCYNTGHIGVLPDMCPGAEKIPVNLIRIIPAEEKEMNGIRSCCLAIAGSDSGGNAGIQADLRTFHAYGLHGCTVFAALTAQNPATVKAVHCVPGEFISAQLDAVFEAYSVSALKTGMLATPDAVEAVAEKLSSRPRIRKVIDPVMVATSGARLSSAETAGSLEKLLLPLADLITPNIPEAEMLSSLQIRTRADVKKAAQVLNGLYGCAVLIKGGHSKESAAEDILFDGEEWASFSLPRIENPVSTHGTGCTLAAAITAELALGGSLKDAISGAKHYVHAAISDSYRVGPNCGVLGFGR